MFDKRSGRGAEVQNGPPSHHLQEASLPTTLVQSICQAALVAHAACASLEPKAFDQRGNHIGQFFAPYQAALLRRREAVNRVFVAPSVRLDDIKAKCALLLALEGWFGPEDPTIGLMALAIAREVHALAPGECACSHGDSVAHGNLPIVMRNWLTRLNPFFSHSA